MHRSFERSRIFFFFFLVFFFFFFLVCLGVINNTRDYTIPPSLGALYRWDATRNYWSPVCLVVEVTESVGDSPGNQQIDHSLSPSSIPFLYFFLNVADKERNWTCVRSSAWVREREVNFFKRRSLFFLSGKVESWFFLKKVPLVRVWKCVESYSGHDRLTKQLPLQQWSPVEL